MRRMPAEWEPHAATWVAWPHSSDTWPGCLAEAQAEFEVLVRVLADSEPVHVLVQDEEIARNVAERLGDLARLGRVRTRAVATDDVWMRDIGPTFVEDDRDGTVAIDWVFNAWGGKYPPWERDDAVARHVAALAGVPCVRSEIVAEGGALEVDGRGTLIATRATLIDERRNPGAGLAEVEHVLRDLLGVTRFLWLDGCIEGDDTDGHVDEIARFAAPGRVVCARESNERDPNHEPLERCRARLLAEPDLEVIDLPMPPPIEADGERLPASYANFYVANAAVLVPAFGADSDVRALDILGGLFPGRKALPIPSRALLRGLGSVHCLTQQQPG
jgi:agmatine deiminase